MPEYFLSLGSNLGDRLDYLRRAAAAFVPQCSAVDAAPVYETAPVCCPEGSAAFLNTVLRIRTPLDPSELHAFTLSLEQAAGRPDVRERNSPRPLDIDILWTSDASFKSSERLVLPHPRLHERRFVLQPLADLAPDLIIGEHSAAALLSSLPVGDQPVQQAHAEWLPFCPYPLRSFTELRIRHQHGPPLSVLTAYDYPTARLLDEAGVDLILVGDSLGMVVLGLPDTTQVTMDHMLHHTEAVARGAGRTLILGDLPYRSYETPEMAVTNAKRLIAAGAHAVKLEGGVSQMPQVRAIIAEGIPLVGHIGMLPQSILEEGGRYRKKGRTPQGAAALLEDALALDAAGACAMVVESVVAEVAQEITQAVSGPTIGIGAGLGTTGQVLVIHDLIGGFPWFRPPFAKQRVDISNALSLAVGDFCQATRTRR